MASRSCSRDDPAPGPGRQTGRQADHACLRIRFRDPGHDRSDPPCGADRPASSLPERQPVTAGDGEPGSRMEKARLLGNSGVFHRTCRAYNAPLLVLLYSLIPVIRDMIASSIGIPGKPVFRMPHIPGWQCTAVARRSGCQSPAGCAAG